MRALLALSTESDAAALSRLVMMQNKDCEIETEADGFSALIALIRKSYDLVILETALPMIPGPELLRYLRMVGRERPVVLAGHHPTFEQARLGILGQVSDFITLPLSDSDRYDLSPDPDAAPDRVDGNRTLEMALEIFDAVTERLKDSGETVSGRHPKIQLLYNTYIEYAFSYFPWLQKFLQMDGLYSDSAPEMPETYRKQLCDLLGTIRRLYPQTGDPLLRDVLSYILTHIDQPLRQKDVAAAFFISPSSLSLLFTENLNLVYNNYIFELKLLRAAYLLQFSDRKVQDISTLLGYQDSGYFSRQFKKAFHVTPSEYRSRSSNGKGSASLC